MFLFVDYQPNIQSTDNGETVSQSKLIVGTPIEGRDGAKTPQMVQVNSFDGDQADVMYGMLVGVKEDGEVKDIEKETVE